MKVNKSIKDAAEETVGQQENIRLHNKTTDAKICYLSTKQKTLRLQIECCSNEGKIREIRQSRNRVLHQI